MSWCWLKEVRNQKALQPQGVYVEGQRWDFMYVWITVHACPTNCTSKNGNYIDMAYIVRLYQALIIYPTVPLFTFFYLLCGIEWYLEGFCFFHYLIGVRVASRGVCRRNCLNVCNWLKGRRIPEPLSGISIAPVALMWSYIFEELHVSHGILYSGNVCKHHHCAISS